MLSINTNLSSLIAQNSMSSATKLLNQAVERMTTGYKINHSKDNAANYSISQKMNMQISSFDVAVDNVAMGMDLITTASDMISLMQDYGTRLQSLCIQARNGTYGQQSIDAINAEVNAIMKEIDRLSSTAEYNGVSLFEGGSEGNGFITDPVSYTESQVAAMTTMTELVNGTTSADNKYSISSAKELEALAEYVNDGNTANGMTFVLGANIDLSSVANWTPIGNANGDSFHGTFDGNRHIIKNLKIDSTDSFQGLFGYVAGGSEIRNVGIENCDVKGGSIYVGGLVGESDGSINNCYVTGNVRGNNNVGGLVGSGYCDINDSYAMVNVSATGEFVGGLKGYSEGDINRCYSTGNVIGNNTVGGLVGYSEGDIFDSYATGNVSGNYSISRLVGEDNCALDNCYATGKLNGVEGVNSSDDWDGTKFNYETSNTSSGIGSFTLQVGINGDSSCQITFDTSLNFDLSAVNSDIASDDALEAIMKFTKQLSEKSTQLGAAENRLQSSLESIEVNIENLTSSLSTIRDADIAEVSSQYIQQQILQQASATLLATANQSPSIALQLI